MGSRVFRAKYYNREAFCCGEPIEIGEDVCYDDSGDLVHADCEETESRIGLRMTGRERPADIDEAWPSNDPRWER